MISRWHCLSMFLVLLTTHVVNCGMGLSAWQFFVGDSKDLNRVYTLSFPPDEGIRLREKFEKKYGVKGEKLIQSFGIGLHPEDLDRPS